MGPYFVTVIFYTTIFLTVQSQITNLCGPSVNEIDHTCRCNNETSLTSGLRVSRIDCSSNGFNSSFFDAEILPLFVDELDMSWNNFEDIPDFASLNLNILRLAHNSIRSTDEKNFINIPNLRELDLSWNGMEFLSMNTFNTLSSLEKLDLSGNNLKKIPMNLFSPLISLEVLDLSWNPQLNKSTDVQELDLFSTYGITPKLKVLKLSHCNLNEIHVSDATKLEKLHLSWNNLSKLSAVPGNVKFIDLSGNPITEMDATIIPHLFRLEVMLLEDMPKLKLVQSHSFFGFPALRILSFQNSRLLNYLHPYSFGDDIDKNHTESNLKSFNLRGTNIRRLNSTLLPALKNLKQFDLTGTPLVCDCHLQWVKHLRLETGGQCNDPVIIRGIKLSQLAESQYECNNTPSWMSQLFNGLLILLLLVLCSAGIWLLVLGLRPSHKKASPTLGSTSPYARITTQPSQIQS